MIKAGIAGAAGYTGGEMLRLLLQHPDVKIVFAQSESKAGKKIYEVHKDIFGTCDLEFSAGISEADVIFLCKGHGEAKQFLMKNPVSNKTKIVDLSQDFRDQETKQFNGREFVYGLPELNHEKIKMADSVANPGCFATAIQLALLPLAKCGLITSDVHINATTGSTGAGQALSESVHFSKRNNNMNAYKVMEHQHEKEIIESMGQLQPSFKQLRFIPQRGAFTRGIFSVQYVNTNEKLEKIEEVYREFYSEHPFTHLVPFEIDLKQVINTNNCFLSLQKVKDQLIIISVIDNLLKGAAGQALQNMNLMFGLSEKTGLQLKANTF